MIMSVEEIKAVDAGVDELLLIHRDKIFKNEPQ